MPRINRKQKKNGSRTKTVPGFTYRVYCAECPRKFVPNEDEYQVISYTNPPRSIRCPQGHVTEVV